MHWKESSRQQQSLEGGRGTHTPCGLKIRELTPVPKVRLWLRNNILPTLTTETDRPTNEDNIQRCPKL